MDRWCDTLHYVCSLTGLGNYLYIEASPETQGQKARLFSPSVDPDTGPLCLMFSYQLEDQATLRVLLQNKHQEETLLWSLRGDQEPIWKEGRTIIPRSPNEFQVSGLDIINSRRYFKLWCLVNSGKSFQKGCQVSMLILKITDLERQCYTFLSFSKVFFNFVINKVTYVEITKKMCFWSWENKIIIIIVFKILD